MKTMMPGETLVANYDLSELAKTVYENNKANGWWASERPWYVCQLLIMTEVAEAVEEYRANNELYSIRVCDEGGWRTIDSRAEQRERLLELCKAGCKSEGFVIELADIVIRCLDWMGHAGHNPGTIAAVASDAAEPIELWLNEMVQYLYSRYGSSFVCLTTIQKCYNLAATQTLDLHGAVLAKIEYNKTRGHRHGNKRI